MGGAIGVLDPLSGVFSPRFVAGGIGWQGLAWDANAQLFYLVNQTAPDFYSFDPRGGVLRSIGDTGVGVLSCLELDATGDLYGISFGSGAIVRIDPTTAAVTQLSTTRRGFQGLGISPASGFWYGTNTSTDGLHLIDPNTGQEVLIGRNGGGVDFAKGFDLTKDSGFEFRGNGCADSTGQALTMQAGGFPTLGGIVRVGCFYASSAPHLLVMGLSDRQWLGLVLPLDLTPAGATGCSLYASQEILVGPLAPGTDLQFAVPLFPYFVGATTHWQGLQIDPALANSLSFASSNLLTVTIQP